MQEGHWAYRSGQFSEGCYSGSGTGHCIWNDLTFARALGEYGATSMLAGNILGKTRTMAVAIAAEVSAQNYDVAGFWVIVLVAIALSLFLQSTS